ncbi:unnamed protein product [Mytilus edulis]|uniref:REJ domain-containing protein n=1 Tax=Mytilus edulis TaxID=6550 RepID=A0A8S3RZW5_MYTED|nr:unnamed protein product [Mytilus edulis]
MDKKLLGSADTIRSATALQAVKVQIGHAPTINILCRKNCLPKLSLNSLLILNADCPECSLSDTKYEWSILVFNHTTEVFDSLNSVPSLTADEIGIRTDAFREMDRIRFHLLIKHPGDLNQADYIVSVNAPPYGGSCSITLIQVNNVINTDRSTQSDTELVNTITELVNDGMIEARISNDPKQVIYQASIIVASIALIVSKNTLTVTIP